jgi:hypothetical protein
MDLTKVFSQEHTVKTDRAWAILMDSFESQAGDLAQVLSLALPQDERAAYVAEYINKARKAIAGLQQEPDAEEHDPDTKKRLEAEALTQKARIVDEMAADLSSHGLASTNQAGKCFRREFPQSNLARRSGRLRKPLGRPLDLRQSPVFRL